MAFKKGQSGNPNGRPAGVPNKATQTVREAIAQFAEGNADRFSEWIGKVAETDPGKAADLYLKAIEYHIPKLARSEVTGVDGAPIAVQEIVIRAVDPAK